MKSFFIISFLCIVSSLSGQTIFKKGYIVNNDNDTIQGFVLVDKLETYYKVVSFKNSRKESVAIFTATDIKAFGFGKNNKYESNILRNPENDSIQGIVFLQIIATQKNGSIYIYEDKKGQQVSYFVKGNDEQLQPLLIEKISAEQYKVAPRKYKLPDGTIFDIEVSNIEIYSQTGEVQTYRYGEIVPLQNIFVYENGELFQVQFVFRQVLLKTLKNEENCATLEDLKVLELKTPSLQQYNLKLNKCNENTSINYINPLGLQVSLMMLGSTHPSSRHRNRGFGIGYAANIRSNTFSPNLSFAFSYFEYDDISVIRVFKSPPDIDGKISTNTVTTRRHPGSYSLGLNYHLFPKRNFRPFASAEFKGYSIEQRLVSIFMDEPNDTRIVNHEYSAQFSIGADYYFANYGQLHFAAGYSGSLYYHLGFGVCIK